MQSQEAIYHTLHTTYHSHFPNMLHGSGGLVDTKGVGTSDVDVCVKHPNYQHLIDIFPKGTTVDHQEGRSIYTLDGFDREVNFYITDGSWWNNAYRHRIVQLALNEQFPELSAQAFNIKKNERIGTEAAWAKVLRLGENYMEDMYDMDMVLSMAAVISAKNK